MARPYHSQYSDNGAGIILLILLGGVAYAHRAVMIQGKAYSGIAVIVTTRLIFGVAVRSVIRNTPSYTYRPTVEFMGVEFLRNHNGTTTYSHLGHLRAPRMNLWLSR